MREMLNKHTTAKAGSPAARLMGGKKSTPHRAMGGTMSGAMGAMDISPDNYSYSPALSTQPTPTRPTPTQPQAFKRGGSSFKARCKAMGGGDIGTNTGSSIDRDPRAAGGAAKTRRNYPMT